jgi:hypothetical protein
VNVFRNGKHLGGKKIYYSLKKKINENCRVNFSASFLLNYGGIGAVTGTGNACKNIKSTIKKS